MTPMHIVVLDEGTAAAAALYETARERLDGLAASVERVMLPDRHVISGPRAHPSGIREYRGTPEEAARHVGSADILLVHVAPVNGDVIGAAPRLRLVGCARSNPVNVDVAACRRRGIPVIHTPGRNATAVAELTLAFILALARRVNELDQAMRTPAAPGLWAAEARDGITGDEVAGATLGIVGFGNIGQLVARRARAFDMKVLACDPYVDPGTMHRLGVEPASLEDILARSDFLTLHAAVPADGRPLLDEGAFRRMKRGARLINTARARLVDEGALVKALEAGHLAGAALDVFSSEPIDAGSPLRRLPNVILTPHIGGLTHQIPARSAHMVVDDVVRWLQGEPLQRAFGGPALNTGGVQHTGEPGAVPPGALADSPAGGRGA